MKKNVVDCYDKTAASYAQKFSNELEHKHFDRLLLKAFADENGSEKDLIDLGCGPGQTTKFLSDCGVSNIMGTDISEAMIKEAKQFYPELSFEVADMLSLKYFNNSFNTAIAFYSIVNFNYEEVGHAFKEVKRILRPGGQFLFSFHIGDSVLHLDNFLDKEVDIDFFFFDVDRIKELLLVSGFEIIDVMQRQPYIAFEYVSQRAYIWAKTAN